MSQQIKYLLVLSLLGFFLITTFVGIVIPETPNLPIIWAASMLLLALAIIYTLTNYNRRFSFVPE